MGGIAMSKIAINYQNDVLIFGPFFLCVLADGGTKEGKWSVVSGRADMKIN